MTKTLIILDGAPATGKTTWANDMRKRIPGVIVTSSLNEAHKVLSSEYEKPNIVIFDPDPADSIQVKHFSRRTVFEVNGEEFSA